MIIQSEIILEIKLKINKKFNEINKLITRYKLITIIKISNKKNKLINKCVKKLKYK